MRPWGNLRGPSPPCLGARGCSTWGGAAGAAMYLLQGALEKSGELWRVGLRLRWCQNVPKTCWFETEFGQSQDWKNLCCETQVAASPRGWRVRTAMTVAPGESLDFFIRHGPWLQCIRSDNSFAKSKTHRVSGEPVSRRLSLLTDYSVERKNSQENSPL